jgi:exodeoxyribonuclease X
MITLTLDTESTGIGTEDQVVEIGVVLRELCSASLVQTWSTLVKPSVPILPTARAAHHITDKELLDAPTMQQIMPMLAKYLKAADTLVGHNLAFDEAMLLQSGVPESRLPRQRICTWKCARHIWPDSPGYGNQTLRYWQEIDVEPNGPPHRALPDAIVTDALMRRMLQEHRPERLIELTATPVLQTKVMFGKYRGKLWSEIEPRYLVWLLHPHRNPPFNEEVQYVARHWVEIHRERQNERKRKQQESSGATVPVHEGTPKNL